MIADTAVGAVARVLALGARIVFPVTDDAHDSATLRLVRVHHLASAVQLMGGDAVVVSRLTG